MAKLIQSLSVFLPAYNEETNLKNTTNKIVKFIDKVTDTWEIIIINDGSKDSTGEIADRLSKENKKIRVVTHSPNRGYGAAFKSGVYNAKYSWIVLNDSDGQFDFTEVTKFIEKQKETGADLVIGYYIDRKVPFITKLTSKMWELVVYLMFGLKVHDIDCGFKLISKKVVEKIPQLESERGAFISSEFLIKAKKYGFKIVEIPVHHYPRLGGKPTGRNINVILKSFVDLARLYKKLRVS